MRWGRFMRVIQLTEGFESASRYGGDWAGFFVRLGAAVRREKQATVGIAASTPCDTRLPLALVSLGGVLEDLADQVASADEDYLEILRRLPIGTILLRRKAPGKQKHK